MSYKPYTSVVLATLAALSVGPVATRAQTLTPRQSRAPATVPALPFPPAGEPSPDTGRMRPARVEWARYDSPAMCLAASRNVQHLTDRREDPHQGAIDPRSYGGVLWDTLAYDPKLDTLSAAARAAARACLARFAVDRVPARELTPFVQTALRAGDDERALAAVDRRLALAASAGPRAQGEVLRAAVDAMLDAHPPRVQTVAALLTRLDALGAPARLPRLFAHATLFTYYVREAVDVAAAKRELEVVRALERALTPDDLVEGILAKSPARIPTLVSEVTLANLDDPRTLASYVTERLADIEREHLDASILEYYRNMVQVYAQILVAPLGKPVPAVRVNYLFTPGEAAPPATTAVSAPVEVRVRPGRSAFWLLAPEDWRENLRAVRKFAAGVRQLRARYGDSVDIVVFTRTMGYTPGSLAQQPAEEVESIRKYFLEFRHLPATLAVSVTPITALPDGRRQPGSVPYVELFSRGRNLFSFVVAGRDGTFARLFQDLRPGTAQYHALDQVVGTHGAEATR